MVTTALNKISPQTTQSLFLDSLRSLQFKLLLGRCKQERGATRVPVAIRELVLDDQRLRNNICWSVFDC